MRASEGGRLRRVGTVKRVMETFVPAQKEETRMAADCVMRCESGEDEIASDIALGVAVV